MMMMAMTIMMTLSRSAVFSPEPTVSSTKSPIPSTGQATGQVGSSKVTQTTDIAMVMHSTHCTLHTAHCTLHTAHCTLHTAHCILHTAHCTLHTAHCTLHTV